MSYLSDSLTSFSGRAGCASKLPPLLLDQILEQGDPSLRLIGDAVEFVCPEDSTALVGSVDFGSAIVDDPEVWANISLANALSDIYAVGGRPLFAMALMGWPSQLDPDLAGRAIHAASRRLRGLSIAFGGGHSIVSHEPLLGFAVVGAAAAHPMSKGGFTEGDDLILTKPIGGGVFLAAQRASGSESPVPQLVLDAMLSLNDIASAAALAAGVRGCTDVSGFGLLGSCYEAAAASMVRIEINAAAVPALAGSSELIETGLVPTRSEETHLWLDQLGILEGNRDLAPEMLMCCPETSGGLLIGCPASKTRALLATLSGARTPGHHIGNVANGRAAVRFC